MSDKARILLLGGIVLALALVWWIGGRSSVERQQRTFREHLLRVDTARLARFTIVPAASKKLPALHFKRDSTGWTTTSEGHAIRSYARPLKKLLAFLVDLQPLRTAGSDPATVARYGLTDSLAPQLELPTVGEHGTRLRIGSTGSSSEEEDPYRTTEHGTPVMLDGDPNVYLVPCTMERIMEMTFDDWIPKPMVNGDPANWTEVTFVFPGRRRYSLVRDSDQWIVNGQPADKEKVDKYLHALSRYHGSRLTDPADTLHAVLVYSMRVLDRSRKNPIILGIFAVDGRLIARSTLAPPWLVMPFDPQRELPRMFRPPEAFMPEDHGQKPH